MTAAHPTGTDISSTNRPAARELDLQAIKHCCKRHARCPTRSPVPGSSLPPVMRLKALQRHTIYIFHDCQAIILYTLSLLLTILFSRPYSKTFPPYYFLESLMSGAQSSKHHLWLETVYKPHMSNFEPSIKSGNIFLVTAG
jgi:hypothetical protein